MKSILTLLFSIGLVTSVFAQSDRRDDDDRNRGDKNSTFDSRRDDDIRYSAPNANSVSYVYRHLNRIIS